MKAYFVGPNNETFEFETPDPPQGPLEGLALAATLNAVLEIWALDDAARVAGLPVEVLVNEALAWAVAKDLENTDAV